jgi:hypothetical protein
MWRRAMSVYEHIKALPPAGIGKFVTISSNEKVLIFCILGILLNNID